ncbi:long-chain fatty acid transporter [Martiniozyma asiatica (nom. inval.)]|nr:long-chain fatty acid transporter [Martiniozyma asiatica]
MLLILSVAVIFAAVIYFKFSDSLKIFERKYRIKDDLYLLPVLGYFFKHFIIQCKITKKFSNWYEIEKNCLNKPKNIALKYVRDIPGKNVSTDFDNAFQIEEITYEELYHMILRMSWILKNEYNVKKGDIVTMYFMNKPLFIIIWISLWNLGAIPAFLNYNLTSTPLIHSVQVVNANLLLVDNECYSQFETTKNEIIDKLPNVNICVIDEFEMIDKVSNKFSNEFREDDKIRDENVNYYDPAVLVYTSGTTGLPKSAVNSWRKIFSATHLFPHAFRMSQSTNIFTAMPLYHGTASVLGVLPALSIGATISLGHKFSLSAYWTQVRLCKANTIQYVGEVCRYLVEANESIGEKEYYGQIKLAYGNGLRRDIWLKLKKRFGIKVIGEFYSSSEAPFATTCYEYNGIGVGAIRNNGWLADKFLSFQYALAKTDPNDDGTIWRNKNGFAVRAAPEEKGEMIMRILNPKNIKATFPGYINNDAATYSKIIKDVFKKGDAWVRSDDLMKFDNLGCLYFIDRLGDTFRWKSENVSTTEVENIILENISSLNNCVVVGAKVDNHEGRAGYALLEPIKGNKIELTLTEREKILNELATTVCEKLPHFARPCFARFESIDLTANHKINKKQFRDPILPSGKNGEQDVWYLNQKEQSYKKLDMESWNSIIAGKIRL